MQPDAAGSRGGEPWAAGSHASLLPIREVAELMRVSRMSVYRLVHAGALPAVRVGGALHVPEPAVHEHLRSSAAVPGGRAGSSATALPAGGDRAAEAVPPPGAGRLTP